MITDGSLNMSNLEQNYAQPNASSSPILSTSAALINPNSNTTDVFVTTNANVIDPLRFRKRKRANNETIDLQEEKDGPDFLSTGIFNGDAKEMKHEACERSCLQCADIDFKGYERTEDTIRLLQLFLDR